MRALHPLAPLLALPALLLAAPGAFAEPVGTSTAAIRNGTRSPQVVPLTDRQQLAIGWLYDPADPATPFCTGTLVAPRVVVTASHCTRSLGPESLGFGIGTDPDAPVALFPLAQVSEFPDPEIDAALLFLAGDAVQQVPEVEPLPVNRTPLDGADGDAIVGRQVEVAGYGETGDISRRGRYFASVTLAEIDPEFVIVDGKGLQGLCFGDSGGPVITMNAAGAPVVLGVEHGGDDSCVGRDFLTRLDPLGDWLMAAVAATEPLVQAGGPCGALTFAGRCVGNVAEWCDESGRVASIDCGVHDRACGFIDEATGYYCTTTKACEVGPDGRCLDGADTAGFVPDGARRVEFVGGCAVGVRGGRDHSGWIFSLLVIAGLARRRR